MKANTGFLIAGAALLFLLLAKTGTGANRVGNLDLSQLTNDSDALGRLNALYGQMLNRGYSNLQILFMLSQILHESGLLTDVANYSLLNQNNYAGLTTTAGGYASFNSVSDFMDIYDNFLTKGSNPLGAGSLIDFNNRLVANHYYTDSPTTYYNSLAKYYNMLLASEV